MDKNPAKVGLEVKNIIEGQVYLLSSKDKTLVDKIF